MAVVGVARPVGQRFFACDLGKVCLHDKLPRLIFFRNKGVNSSANKLILVAIPSEGSRFFLPYLCFKAPLLRVEVSLFRPFKVQGEKCTPC